MIGAEASKCTGFAMLAAGTADAWRYQGVASNLASDIAGRAVKHDGQGDSKSG
jgi:hypothetical protein